MPKSTYEKITQLKKFLSPPNKPASLMEIANYMNCDVRTVYRHIEKLESENCGLKREKSSKKFFIQPPSQHPENIIRGLKTALKVLEGMGTPHSKNVTRAIEYLKGDSTAETETMAHALNVDDDFVVDLGPFSEYSERPDRRAAEIDKLLAAIKDRAKLLVTYVPGHDNTQEEVLDICPLKLVLRIDTLYLVAKMEFDQKLEQNLEFDQKLRLLAVGRIKNWHRSGASFPPIDFDYKSLYKNCFGKFSGRDFEKIRLVMEVKSSWLQTQFRKAHFNPEAKVRRQKPMVVELNIFDTPDFEGWLLGILPDVKILEPASLIDNLKAKLKKSAEAL